MQHIIKQEKIKSATDDNFIGYFRHPNHDNYGEVVACNILGFKKNTHARKYALSYQQVGNNCVLFQFAIWQYIPSIIMLTLGLIHSR